MKRHPVVAANLAFFLLFFSVGQVTAQENLPRLVKKIQPAVVTIIAYDKQGKVIGQGSGFFINQDGRFLTNYHVLAGANRALVKTATDAAIRWKGWWQMIKTGTWCWRPLRPRGGSQPENLRRLAGSGRESGGGR